MWGVAPEPPRCRADCAARDPRGGPRRPPAGRSPPPGRSARASAPSSRPRAASSAEKLALLEATEARLREAFSALSSDALQQNNEVVPPARPRLAGRVPAGRDRRPRRPPQGDRIDRPAAARVADAGRHQAAGGRAGPGVDPGAARRTDARAHPGAADAAVRDRPARRARCARRTSAASGASCSCAACSRTPGSIEGSHFELKESIQTEDGRLTPDVIVRLPGGKNVVRRRQGAAQRVPRRGGNRRRGEARREAARPRPAGEGPRHAARQQELLGALPAGARHRRHVRARASRC